MEKIELYPINQQSYLQSKMMFQDVDLNASDYLQESFEEQKVASLSPSPHTTPSKSPKKQKYLTKLASDSKANQKSQSSATQHFGHWQQWQNKRYHWFMEIHSHHFLNKHLRRLDKIFKSMATFVGSREAYQCRSHHQKMEKKFGHSIAQILLYLRGLHYSSGDSSHLEEELKAKEIGFSDPLLSEEFLQALKREKGKEQLNKEEKKEINNVQQSLDSFNQSLFCIGLESIPDEQAIEGFQKSLVDSLFDIEAPHFDYSLI